MNKVHRTGSIRRAIETRIMNRPARKYVTAGSEFCSRMMCEARRHRVPCPSDSAILARAQFDLNREIMCGFWQQQEA